MRMGRASHGDLGNEHSLSRQRSRSPHGNRGYQPTEESPERYGNHSRGRGERRKPHPEYLRRSPPAPRHMMDNNKGQFDDRRGGGGHFDDRRGGGHFDGRDKRGGGGHFDDRRGGGGHFDGRRGGGGHFDDRRGGGGHFDGRRGGGSHFDGKRGGGSHFNSRRGGGGHFDGRRGGGGHFDGRRGGGSHFDDRRESGGHFDDRDKRGSSSHFDGRRGGGSHFDDRRGGGGHFDRGRGGGHFDGRGRGGSHFDGRGRGSHFNDRGGHHANRSRSGSHFEDRNRDSSHFYNGPPTRHSHLDRGREDGGNKERHDEYNHSARQGFIIDGFRSPQRGPSNHPMYPRSSSLERPPSNRSRDHFSNHDRLPPRRPHPPSPPPSFSSSRSNDSNRNQHHSMSPMRGRHHHPPNQRSNRGYHRSYSNSRRPRMNDQQLRDHKRNRHDMSEERQDIHRETSHNETVERQDMIEQRRSYSPQYAGNDDFPPLQENNNFMYPSSPLSPSGGDQLEDDADRESVSQSPPPSEFIQLHEGEPLNFMPNNAFDNDRQFVMELKQQQDIDENKYTSLSEPPKANAYLVPVENVDNNVFVSPPLEQDEFYIDREVMYSPRLEREVIDLSSSEREVRVQSPPSRKRSDSGTPTFMD